MPAGDSAVTVGCSSFGFSASPDEANVEHDGAAKTAYRCLSRVSTGSRTGSGCHGTGPAAYTVVCARRASRFRAARVRGAGAVTWP